MLKSLKKQQCLPGCGACCIAPSISGPIPGMPNGKPAAVRCINLDKNNDIELVSLIGNANIRFGSTDNMKDKFIPTLSLQMLIENAIKHNVISSKAPLFIKVVNNDDVLVVENNLQLRKSEVISTGLGQKNIIRRYELISNLKPSFYKRDDFYIAKLPLISES